MNENPTDKDSTNKNREEKADKMPSVQDWKWPFLALLAAGPLYQFFQYDGPDFSAVPPINYVLLLAGFLCLLFSDDEEKLIAGTVKAVFPSLPVIGLPWLVGWLAIDGAILVFMILLCFFWSEPFREKFVKWIERQAE